jgi:hypothetical protein
MLIEIKGYAKPAKHQFEKNMEYDGMNKDEINPNVHGCMVNPMSMLKREDNMVKLGAIVLPLRSCL